MKLKSKKVKLKEGTKNFLSGSMNQREDGLYKNETLGKHFRKSIVDEIKGSKSARKDYKEKLKYKGKQALKNY